jgi:hypothetical protein
MPVRITPLVAGREVFASGTFVTGRGEQPVLVFNDTPHRFNIYHWAATPNLVVRQAPDGKSVDVDLFTGGSSPVAFDLVGFVQDGRRMKMNVCITSVGTEVPIYQITYSVVSE